jgi:hypothetical protein
VRLLLSGAEGLGFGSYAEPPPHMLRPAMDCTRFWGWKYGFGGVLVCSEGLLGEFRRLRDEWEGPRGEESRQ